MRHEIEDILHRTDMIAWLRRLAITLALLAALFAGMWWFVQRTESCRAAMDLALHSTVVEDEIGPITAIRLPFLGYGITWADGEVSLHYNFFMTGADGHAKVNVTLVDGHITAAEMVTVNGDSVPLVVPR